MKITGNEPANPIVNSDGYCTLINNIENHDAKGLTIRQQFAMAAMQGLVANPEWMEVYKGEKYLMQNNIIVEVSVSLADALIEELNKEKTQ